MRCCGKENDDMNQCGFFSHTRLGFPFMAYDGDPDASPRRRRLRTRLGIGTGCVLVAVTIAACSSAGSHAAPGPSASSPQSPHAVTTPSSSISEGPLACVTAGKSAQGSGPWKLVAPSKLCGLPVQTSSEYVQSGQSLASLDKIVLKMQNAGTVTSTVTAAWQSPRTPNFDRGITFVGFEGTFKLAAALNALELPGETYTSVAPGPHGGTMACSGENDGGNCVWATSTTVCEITISDSTRQLLGSNIAANAVRIRDALEAPA
jgi:hypothetical protein